MIRTMKTMLLGVLAVTLARAQNAADWPCYRGPDRMGIAPAGNDAVPLEWSDTKNIGWKVPIPGRGFSSPILWGDKLFLTTAVPTSTDPAPAASSGGQQRGPGGGVGAGREHKFVVLCLDRKIGRAHV